MAFAGHEFGRGFGRGFGPRGPQHDPGRSAPPAPSGG
jgi:hypothetical protein